jgi:hypothetical protein
LAYLADPFDYTTYVNQLDPGKQFAERGANVNVLNPKGAARDKVSAA